MMRVCVCVLTIGCVHVFVYECGYICDISHMKVRAEPQVSPQSLSSTAVEVKSLLVLGDFLFVFAAYTRAAGSPASSSSTFPVGVLGYQTCELWEFELWSFLLGGKFFHLLSPLPKLSSLFLKIVLQTV